MIGNTMLHFAGLIAFVLIAGADAQMPASFGGGGGGASGMSFGGMGGMAGMGMGMMYGMHMPLPPQRVKHLRDNCTSNGECQNAFALCLNGKCTCHLGYAENNATGICEVQVATCAHGEPLRSNNSGLVRCAKHMRPGNKTSSGNSPYGMLGGPIPIFDDTCPEGHECHMPNGIYGGLHPNDTTLPGICCQKPSNTGKCPFGLPDPNATCGDPFSPRHCSHETHTCVFHGGLESITAGNGICCPGSACNNIMGMALVTSYQNGKCMRMFLTINDPCELDMQCGGNNQWTQTQQTMGCIAGKCACKPGFIIETTITGIAICSSLVAASDLSGAPVPLDLAPPLPAAGSPEPTGNSANRTAQPSSTPGQNPAPGVAAAVMPINNPQFSGVGLTAQRPPGVLPQAIPAPQQQQFPQNKAQFANGFQAQQQQPVMLNNAMTLQAPRPSGWMGGPPMGGGPQGPQQFQQQQQPFAQQQQGQQPKFNNVMQGNNFGQFGFQAQQQANRGPNNGNFAQPRGPQPNGFNNQFVPRL